MEQADAVFQKLPGIENREIIVQHDPLPKEESKCAKESDFMFISEKVARS
jgi:hypothetical protein